MRRAGAFETAYFSSSGTFDEEGVWLGAPNAALTGTHNDKPYVVIVTLSSPTYSNQTNVLEYTVRTMKTECSKLALSFSQGARMLHTKDLKRELRLSEVLANRPSPCSSFS
jgi:hypothetical protein